MIITDAKAMYAGQSRAGQKTDKAPKQAPAEKKGFSEELFAASKQTDTEEMMQFIRDKRQELFEKLQKGETQQKIQIGAQAYTQKEWKRLLEAFDGVEDEKKRLLEEMMRKRAVGSCSGEE